jgi:hypothetical protein
VGVPFANKGFSVARGTRRFALKAEFSLACSECGSSSLEAKLSLAFGERVTFLCFAKGK